MVDVAPHPHPSAVIDRSAAGWIDTLDHRHDHWRSSQVALATPGERGWDELTYDELASSSDAVAAWLIDRQVTPGERVLLWGEASGHWVAAFLGILRAGAVVVPVDPRAEEAEVAAMVERTTPSAALVATGLRPTVARAGLAERVLDLASVPGLPGPRPSLIHTARSMDDPAVVVWTSGTTGPPKGVTLTYANLDYAVATSIQVQHLGADDRWLSVLPLNHLLALTCGLLGALRTGASLAFCASLMPGEIADMMAERRVTHMMVVPLLARLLSSELNRLNTGDVRALFAGGAPLDPALVDAYQARGIPLLQGYGLSEVSPIVAMNTVEHHRVASVGRPLPGTEIRIGAGGEILVRSPGVMAGYWEQDSLTDEVLDADGWLHTGDLGHADADGFLFVTGRAKDLVVLESGKKVQPSEVENVLRASPLFGDVCVVGVASAAGAEEVGAVVVPVRAMARSEVEAEVARLAMDLCGYQRPRWVEISDEALPLTAKRSVRRAEVARMAAERRRHRETQR